MVHTFGGTYGLVERIHYILFSQVFCCLSVDGEKPCCVQEWNGIPQEIRQRVTEVTLATSTEDMPGQLSLHV